MDRSSEKREEHTNHVDKERKEEGKKTDEAVSNQIKNKGDTKKETMALHYVLTYIHISMS